jgi:hypothetical protein
MTAPGVGRHLAATRHHRRGRLVAVLTAALLVGLAGPAYAYWTATSTGNAQASAATLANPVLTAGSVTATAATLSWTQPFAPTGYTLSQSPGTLTTCPAAPAASPTTCSATSLTPNTTYTWALSASLHNWVSSATVSATTPKQATTTTLGAVTPTTGAAGATFSATATVAGWGTPAGTVLFSLYPNSTCTGAASYTSSQALSAGAATATLDPAAGTYSWQAGYAPTDAYNAPSTSACSPSITVTTGGLTYAGGSSQAGQNNGGQNVTVPYPTGTKQGDLVLLVLANHGSKTDTPVSTGWTLVADDSSTGGLAAWWHVAGTETGVTLSSLGVSNVAWVLDYTKATPPVLALNGKVSGVSSAPGATFTPASLTATQASTVISLAAIGTAGTLSLQAAQGFGLHASLATTSRALGVADRYAGTAGPVASPTWAGGTATSSWAYITMGFTSGP